MVGYVLCSSPILVLQDIWTLFVSWISWIYMYMYIYIYYVVYIYIYICIYIYIYNIVILYCLTCLISKMKSSLGQTLKHKPSNIKHNQSSVQRLRNIWFLHFYLIVFFVQKVFWTNQNLIVLGKCPILFILNACIYNSQGQVWGWLFL